MHSLPLFHRITGHCVIVLGEGEGAEAKRRLVERAGGLVSDDPAAQAALAFVALDAPEDIAAALKARGLLVNVVDRPDLCDFTVPSLLERGAVLVAVGTGGVSAGLAKALRLRLETLLPGNLGALAEGLGRARAALRARWPQAPARRRVLDAALAEGGALDPLNDQSSAALSGWLASPHDTSPTVHEFIVATDDPDELTLRQARWLGTADLVMHDPGVSSAMLNRARADAVRRPLLAGDDAIAHSGVVVIIRRG